MSQLETISSTSGRVLLAIYIRYKYDINVDQRGFSIVFYGWSDRFTTVFQNAIKEIHA